MKKSLCFLALILLSGRVASQNVNLVFVSDLHYGITRPHFRGQDSVSGKIVNRAMVAMIDTLNRLYFPLDKGMRAGKKISRISGIIITGDIANRQQPPVQSASLSWQQFIDDYQGILHYPLYPLPGNHDVSNAIGYTKELIPALDAGSMAGIYNIVMHASITAGEYDYAKQKINYSRDINGVHLIFVNIWPDSLNRVWMEQDLARVGSKTPVLIFAHDPPAGDYKHFTNPNGNHDINAADNYENLLPEMHKDVTLEQTDFDSFITSHPNIRAYFHGHENFCQMYDYKGVRGNLLLPVFRADSPMKGEKSRPDEHELSIQVISFDSHKLTVRELLWNTVSGKPEWRRERTIGL
jgi:hypothetical protein